LDEIIRACLYDEHLAWELKGETWSSINGDAAKDTHEIFEKVYEHQVMTKTAKKKKVCLRSLSFMLSQITSDEFHHSFAAAFRGRRLTKETDPFCYRARSSG
jgi:hypothetical protein